MLIENTGTKSITLVVEHKLVEIKPTQAVDVPESTYKAVKALFPHLLPIVATETVEIESEPEEIAKVAKNGKKRKKSGK